MTDLLALPKAELHLHLEGAIRADTAAELAARHGVPAPPTGPFAGLGDFVVAYERARDLIGSLEDLHRVARELVEDAAAQGVVWTEVHLIPRRMPAGWVRGRPCWRRFWTGCAPGPRLSPRRVSSSG
ncbi:hypothetical protein [Oryzihumus sp.]